MAEQETWLPIPAPSLRRTVRVGVAMTYLAVGVALLTPLLPGTAVRSWPSFLVLLAAILAVAIAVSRADWDVLLASNRGPYALEAWASAMVVLVTATVFLTGGPSPEGHLYVLLVVTYAGLIMPRNNLARVTLLGLGGTALLGWQAAVPVGPMVTRLSAVGFVAAMAHLGSVLLAERIQVAEDAEAAAAHRAALLGIVASSARSLNTLDPEAMVRRFVESAVSLGFEAGNLCRFDDDLTSYEVLAPVGHGDLDYYRQRHPTDRGMVALVLDRGEPVVVEDYSRHPLTPEEIRGEGYRCVVAVPIWMHGELAACLIVGTRARDTVEASAVESLELLAALAGRALENAERFDAELHRAAQAAELARLKSDFVSNVSHELRTPLTVIEGIGQTLQTRSQQMDDDLRASLVTRLTANARSLHEILNRLLDFSRLESGNVRIHVGEVKLCQLAEDVLERMAPTLVQHDVLVDIDVPVPVRADAVLAERVIENLLSNAVKHTPPGTMVEVALRRGRTAARLTVTDNGPGIPPDEVVRLTERFYRGGDPNTRERKGLGLGLALVDELLSLHGSQLEITSRVGHGSTFAFELPLSHDTAGLTGQWHHDPDPRLTAGPG